MKRVIFYGKHDLRMEEREDKPLRDREVRIKVMACGICGTDVHIWEGDKGAADTPPGTVLGHEFSGIVEETGPGVEGFKPGDRVCVDPNKVCGECSGCRSGRGHFCTAMTGIGTTVDGGFSQYCNVPVSQVYPIADSTTFRQAAMAEPVACCLHGIDLCNIKPGSRVMIIGGGMIGLIMLQLARMAGACQTIILEPLEEKRQQAKGLGADLVIDPYSQEVSKILMEEGIKRLDTVIECVGKPETIQSAVEYAGTQATVMLFGLTKPEEKVELYPYQLFKKEITLKSSFINPYTQERAIELIDSGKIDVSSMIYGCISMEEMTGLMGNKEKRGKGKYIVEPWK